MMKEVLIKHIGCLTIVACILSFSALSGSYGSPDNIDMKKNLSLNKREYIMRKYLRNILYGFLAWLIPFIASFLFYTAEGELTIDIFLFKSIMIVVGSFSAALLLIYYFKKINADYFKEGIIVGSTWFGINILLDLLVLIPMSGMPLSDYFTQIGIRYLVIPAMSIAVGTALDNKK